MTVHHVFPYDPGHLGLSVDAWWDGQLQRWPLAAVARSRQAPVTVVHVITKQRIARSGRGLRLVGHPTLYDNVRWHAWGDDWSLSLGRALARTGPEDIVVVHLEGYAAARLAIRYAARSRVVLVLHGRGTGSLAEHAAVDHTVVLHDGVRSALLEGGVPPERLTQLVPSVDRDLFRPAPEGSTHRDSVRLGYVGRLEPTKGVFELPSVLSGVSDLRPELECIGTPPTPRDELAARAAFAGSEFTLLGELAPTAVAARMRDWDALLLPSYTEGCPLVVLEALSSQTPVVAVDGVLPGSLASREGVYEGPRDGMVATLRRAIAGGAPAEPTWVPTHADGGRHWDDLYASLPSWTLRERPSARPLAGRLRRASTTAVRSRLRGSR